MITAPVKAWNRIRALALTTGKTTRPHPLSTIQLQHTSTDFSTVCKDTENQCTVGELTVCKQWADEPPDWVPRPRESNEMAVNHEEQYWIKSLWNTCSPIYCVHQKRRPLKNFADFLTTVESYYINFCILFSHLLSRKFGKFCCIILTNDKVTGMLFLVTTP